MKAQSSRSPKPSKASPEETVRAIFRKLSRAWGEQHWWPAETPFEVIAGAILTQNTSWTNVDRALANLRGAGLLSVDGIRQVPLARLEALVRSSGYYRQKSERLKNFVAWLDARYDGSLKRMFATPTEALRAELLAQKGIGPETADAILLYAGHHPVFVVDAYARRILERHEAIAANTKYDELRVLVERALQKQKPAAGTKRRLSASRPPVHGPSLMSTAPRSALAQTYNEMHGLIVQVGKHYCHKRQPDCDNCPLGAMLSPAERKKVAESASTRRRAAVGHGEIA